MNRNTIAAIILFLTLLYSFKGNKPAEYAPPNWAKDAVWYQIFPERFCNGDQKNDPSPADMAGGWPYFVPEGWQISPWTADWFALQPWEKDIPWHQHFDWAKEGEINFGATAGLRRYGGDLQGVIDRLDYLQDLGITAIYFNPLFESVSNHKYNATYFHHIDNNFGPNPEKDKEIWAAEDPGNPDTWRWTSADSLFLKLIEDCHRRGMKVIIDGVFNHTGVRFWAFQDIVKNQQASKYKHWFDILAWDNPETPENEFDYAGWIGIKDLPEIREDEDGLIKDFQDHVHAIVKRWMDPNGDGDPSDGVDGWRLDVAEKVNIRFWQQYYQWVKAINPEAYLTGELWWEDWGENKMFNAAPWFDGAFDACMNYRFSRAVKKYVIDHEWQISGQAFVDTMKTIYRDYHWENVLACQNLMDSHDVDRLASQIVNGDRYYDHDANPMQNENYNPRKPTEMEYKKQRLIVGMQMTMPGAPMIYYGDEAGMWGGDDPNCRKPMTWPEMRFDMEKAHPKLKKRAADTVGFNKEMFDWYQKVIHIRKANPALSRGEISFFLIDDASKMLGFVRRFEGQEVYVILNNTEASVTTYLNLENFLGGEVTLKNLVNGETLSGYADLLLVKFEPYEIKILVAGG